MRLKNKQTGEIGTLNCVGSAESILILDAENYNKNYTYSSLAELNAEWEDMPEEPKKHYEILGIGVVIEQKDSEDEIFRNQNQREIGNYFETKEEAELVVRKLEAWKRLKDKGFRFKRWMIPEEPKTPHIKLVIEAEMDVPDSPYDLDLLFGGEE